MDFFLSRRYLLNFVANMKEFVISEAKAETAVLVGLITKDQDEAKTKEYLDELEFLAHRETVYPEGGRTESDDLCGIW